MPALLVLELSSLDLQVYYVLQTWVPAPGITGSRPCTAAQALWHCQPQGEPGLWTQAASSCRQPTPAAASGSGHSTAIARPQGRQTQSLPRLAAQPSTGQQIPSQLHFQRQRHTLPLTRPPPCPLSIARLPVRLQGSPACSRPTELTTTHHSAPGSCPQAPPFAGGAAGAAGLDSQAKAPGSPRQALCSFSSHHTAGACGASLPEAGLPALPQLRGHPP